MKKRKKEIKKRTPTTKVIVPVPVDVRNAMTGFVGKYHDMIVQCGAIDPKMMKQSRDYSAAAELVQLHNPAVRLVQARNERGETRVEQRIRHMQEQRAFNQIDPVEKVTQLEVESYIKRGLDDVGAGIVPNVTEYVRSTGASQRHIKAVQTRDKSSVIRDVLDEQASHPVLTSIQQYNPEGVTDMHTGTVSKALRKVRGQYTIAQRLAVQEAKMAQVEQMMRSLMRVDTNWHAVVQGMYDAGESIKQIAAVTGQQYNTVKVMLRRYRKANSSLSVVGGTE